MTALLTKAAALVAAASGVYWAFWMLSGAWAWLAVTLGSLSLFGAIFFLLGTFMPSLHRWKGLAINSLVAFATTGLVFTSLELFLLIYDAFDYHASIEAEIQERHSPRRLFEPSAAWIEPKINSEVPRIIAARGNPLTMPEAWKQRRVEVAGAKKAYYWHGVLHVEGENRSRRNTPFTQKKAGTFRIMVVGDSLTFGVGVDERWTYPAVLERRLRNDFNVEILNLGRNGAGSEDILEIIQTWLPRLSPDVVVYGVCLNDFLPSGLVQDVYDTAYALPLPRSFSDHLTQKTRLGAFLSYRYDALLRKWDLRRDFFDGILADLEGHQARFSNDVAEMNAFVESRGLPPIVGMVLEQYPRYNGRSFQLARIAEEAMGRAGFTVVPTEDYFRRYHGENFAVSEWEGHPNEEAHQIFSSMLEVPLRQQSVLTSYRKARSGNHAILAKD